MPDGIDPGPASGRLGETPNAPPKQSVPAPEGAQEQPLGVRGEESAAVASGQHQSPKGFTTETYVKSGPANAYVESAALKELKKEIPDYDRYLPILKVAIRRKNLNISEESAVAIHHYTGRAYVKINRALRDGVEFPGLKEIVARLSEGIKMMPAARGQVWRSPASSKKEADILWNRAIRGEYLDIGNQFQSFTTNRAFAERISRRSELMLYIREPKEGAYIADISKYPNQKEVLFAPDLKYRVVGMRQEGHPSLPKRIIELEIVHGQ